MTKSRDPKTIEWSCGVCKRCRLVVEGPLAGKCYYGGPYRGYWDVEAKTLKTLDKTPQSTP